MRKLLLIVPFLLIGCSSQTPEEKEAAKFPQPKMLSEEEGKKIMQGDQRGQQDLASKAQSGSR